jgi:hypothetical protein
MKINVQWEDSRADKQEFMVIGHKAIYRFVLAVNPFIFKLIFCCNLK